MAEPSTDISNLDWLESEQIAPRQFAPQLPPHPPMTQAEAWSTMHNQQEPVNLNMPGKHLSYYTCPSANTRGKTHHKPFPDYLSRFIPPLLTPGKPDARHKTLTLAHPERLVVEYGCGCTSMDSCIHSQISFDRSKLPDGTICDLYTGDDVPEKMIKGRRKCPGHQDHSGLEKNHVGSRPEDILPTDEQQERYVELMKRSMKRDWDGVEQSTEVVGRGWGKAMASRGRPTGQARWAPYGDQRPVTSSRQISESAGMVKQTSAAVSREPAGARRRGRALGQTRRESGDSELADALPRTSPLLEGVAMPSRASMANEPLLIPEPNVATTPPPAVAAAVGFSPLMQSIEVPETPLMHLLAQSMDCSFLDPNRPLEPWEQDILGGDVDYDEFFGGALG
jgi:hypothetical protein